MVVQKAPDVVGGEPDRVRVEVVTSIRSPASGPDWPTIRTLRSST
jgi:hypothetical protein